MILDRFLVTDKVAIVTGAGRGIGRGIALALAEAGADVVCAARSVDQIDATAADVRDLGRRALAVPTDVTDRPQLEALVAFSETEIAFVQNRCYARGGWDRRVRAFCAEHAIVYQGFSLLTANERELSTAPARKIAERHQRTIAQVVFRFAMQIGMLPLTGTTSAQHMKEDLSSNQFDLSAEDLRQIETIAL